MGKSTRIYYWSLGISDDGHALAISTKCNPIFDNVQPGDERLFDMEEIGELNMLFHEANIDGELVGLSPFEAQNVLKEHGDRIREQVRNGRV